MQRTTRPLKASTRTKRNEGFGADAGREGIYTYLWPNFMLNVYPGGGNASTNLIVPIDERHCLAVYEFFFAETMPEEEQRRWSISSIRSGGKTSSSSSRCSLDCDRGSKQGQLVLSRENGIQHFQKLVFSALTGSP